MDQAGRGRGWGRATFVSSRSVRRRAARPRPPGGRLGNVRTCGTTPIWVRYHAASTSRSSSVSSSRIAPPVGSYSRWRSAHTVVFPLPERPTCRSQDAVSERYKDFQYGSASTHQVCQGYVVFPNGAVLARDDQLARYGSRRLAHRAIWAPSIAARAATLPHPPAPSASPARTLATRHPAPGCWAGTGSCSMAAVQAGHTGSGE